MYINTLNSHHHRHLHIFMHRSNQWIMTMEIGETLYDKSIHIENHSKAYRTHKKTLSFAYKTFPCCALYLFTNAYLCSVLNYEKLSIFRLSVILLKWRQSFGYLWQYSMSICPARASSCVVSNQNQNPYVLGTTMWIYCKWTVAIQSIETQYWHNCLRYNRFKPHIVIIWWIVTKQKWIGKRHTHTHTIWQIRNNRTVDVCH